MAGWTSRVADVLRVAAYLIMGGLSLLYMGLTLWQVAVNTANDLAILADDPVRVLLNMSVVGPLGMNDAGRWAFCESVNRQLQRDQKAVGNAGLSVSCEGRSQTIELRMANSLPIISGWVQPDDIVRHMQKPYQIALKGWGSLALTGDKWTRVLDSPIPTDQIRAKLEGLGVKTVADFYAACGFNGFVLLDEEENSVYLELKFTTEYAKNPTAVCEYRRCE